MATLCGQFDWASHQRRGRAFTLFELVTVVFIIGVAAAVLFAAVGGDLHSARLATAANVLASDIEFCQEECINRPNTPRAVSFDTAHNKYSIIDTTTSQVIPHPADSLPFINDFLTGRNAQLAGVSITALTMGSGTLNLLTFDSYGRPTGFTADFVITLSYNGNTMKVTVKQGTGDVTIQ